MNIGSLVLVFVCLAIGYICEPIFFSEFRQETKEPDSSSTEDPSAKTAEEPKKKVSSNETPEIQIDLTRVLKEDFPQLVTLKSPYTLSDSASALTMELKQGAEVKPLSIEGNQLIFQFKGLPMKGKIKVSNTNFKALITPVILKRLQNAPAKPEKKKTDIITTSAKVITTEATSSIKTEATPSIKAEVSSPIKPFPKTVSAPITAPVEPKDFKAVNSGSIIALMRSNISAGKIKEFKTNQVTEWKLGRNIKINGKYYQTGIATFMAKTFLGEQKSNAMALIRDGVIVKWVWANKRQLEMR